VHRHPSLRAEDVGLLFEAVRQRLAEKGYQRRDMAWYSYSPELIRVLSFDPGLTWVRARFAVGISLRVLDGVDEPTVWDSIGAPRCRATHPQIDDCSISVRLERLVEDHHRYEALTDFTDRSRSHPDSIPQILGIVTTCALPFLESFSTLDDVRRFARSERAAAFDIREAAKTILCT